MNKIISYYIAKQVIIATCLVIVILVGIECFMLFFQEVSSIGKANYSAVKAFLYVLMQIPFNIYQLFPMAGFLGCLIGLGRLASKSELVVMQASGVSIINIIWAVIKAALLMIVVMTIVGEVVAPQLQAYSERMKTVALGDAKSYSRLNGFWLRNKNYFIHIGAVISNEKVENVSFFKVEGQKLRTISYAATATKVAKSQWQFQNVSETNLEGDKVTTRNLAKLNLAIQFDPVLLSLGNDSSVDQLTLMALYHSAKYRKQIGLFANQYQYAFWQRLFQPVSVIIMIILGVPFVFGSLRSSTMGLRVLTGIIVGFSFYMINRFIGPIAVVYQISPIIAALLPALIFLILCVILFRRISRAN